MRPEEFALKCIPPAVLSANLGFRLLAFSRCVRQETRGSLDVGAQAGKYQFLGCGTSRVAAVSDQDASGIFELANQVSPLHPIDNSATRRTPGISPLVKSR
jgi:hypothetical protein